jgi:hypothetical protein
MVLKLWFIIALLASTAFGASLPQAGNTLSVGGVDLISNMTIPMPAALPGLTTLYSNKSVTASGTYHLYKNGAIFTVANGSSFTVFRVCYFNEGTAGRAGQFVGTTTTYAEAAASSGLTSATFQNGSIGSWGWLAASLTVFSCEDAIYTFTGASGGSGGGTIVGYEAGVSGVQHLLVWGITTTP